MSFRIGACGPPGGRARPRPRPARPTQGDCTMRGQRTAGYLAVALAAALAPQSAQAQAVFETFNAGPFPSQSFRPRLIGQGWAFVNNSTAPRAQDPTMGG